MATPIYLRFDYGCFPGTELSSCHQDCVAMKPEIFTVCPFAEEVCQQLINGNPYFL